MRAQVETSTLKMAAGITRGNRAHLERLHHLTGAFGVDDASRALDLPPPSTRRLLGYFGRRGWLARVRRGLYVAVPLDARQSGQWVEDPWIAADRTFGPCYMGGWTACQHWDLTEQLFRTILVITGRTIRKRKVMMQGTPYQVTTRSPSMLFGTVGVWRGQVRVQVSDPTRTIADILDDPSLGGGIRTVADVVHAYLTGDHRDDALLVDYVDRLGNRAAFKRLGWIAEHGKMDTPALIAACRHRISTGLVRLDPSVATPGRIVRRWALRVNVDLETPGGEW